MHTNIKPYLASLLINSYVCQVDTHKDKYLEIRNSIIQSVISREGLKLHAYNSLQIYSYL